jgi:cell division protein FtsI (penicillin-binding protein 3)
VTNKIPLRRAGALGAALLICMAAIGVRLGYVQGVRAQSYTDLAERQRLRKIELPARRGTILDRNGDELAVSVPARTIYANPRLITDPAATARALAPILKRDAPAIEDDLRKDSGFVYLARRVGLVTAAKIEKLGPPGVGILDEARRLYPGGSLASNVVGFIGTDQHGLSGLEYAFDGLLDGEAGWRVLEQDPRGRRIPQGLFTEVLPQPGADLQLTIDPDIQLSAERALAAAVKKTKASGGMVTAIDPRTGEVLAMASNPTFNPNDLHDVDMTKTRNRVVTDTYEPGSINKIVMASAALNEHIVKPDEKIFVPESMRIGDHTFGDDHNPGGSFDLRWILAHSSNLGTIRIAQMLGKEKLEEYFHRLGYGKTTGLGFPGESAGNVPPIGRWATSLPTMAIGQSLTITPIQIAQVYAMVANDGVSIEPRLLARWTDANGKEHASAEPRARRILPADVARTLRSMLRSVVTDGTGKLAAIPHYQVAGKTGTARRAVEGVGYSGYFSSFVGMLPAANPEIVIGVALDNPTPIEGGLVAAPVFSRVAKDAARILRITPDS